MLIGVPKEIKNHEYRVGLTPSGVKELVKQGHTVMIQRYAGDEIGFSAHHYIGAGAQIVDSAEEIFARADMIVKVKEPQACEIAMLRAGQILFTYLHLAPDPEQTQGLIKSDCIAIAYETVTDGRGGLPLLAPMSEVAGRMSIQAGAHCLEKAQGGAGILLSGVPGVAPANVVVLGGGVVGINAARMAMGLGAKVSIFDVSLNRLKEIDTQFGPQLTTLYSTTDAIEVALASADLVIGAVLIPGAAAPKLVSKQMLKLMKPGSVLVDVAIDQGGCFETSHPTTHESPTYVVDNIIHYCVANMPGGVARTATLALTNATMPFVLAIANKGWQRALNDDIHLRNGLNICQGKVAYAAVARDLELDYTPAELLL
ncbi:MULTISPECIES: alanine dehydrogenase [Deefgea]|uniref:Alanine dehydrogenase n=1 Tax=Deefgea chitinilytica TaxID=570276 RepID=A0ABS2CFB6_9NEIS|nr:MULTISPECIES: alanine dehydrogenase [Deefgea]MBM5572123.1 alanine dehydrogenase [Deefgea chitinilytica]MBM9889358.1 alanine dehydrogenase [Deefgea sp. CFH1-16]